MEKQPIPTAETFIRDKISSLNKSEMLLPNKIIEFATLHVQESLKAAAENAYAEPVWNEGRCDFPVNKNSILNAYPLDNIK